MLHQNTVAWANKFTWNCWLARQELLEVQVLRSQKPYDMLIRNIWNSRVALGRWHSAPAHEITDGVGNTLSGDPLLPNRNWLIPVVASDGESYGVRLPGYCKHIFKIVFAGGWGVEPHIALQQRPPDVKECFLKSVLMHICWHTENMQNLCALSVFRDV